MQKTLEFEITVVRERDDGKGDEIEFYLVECVVDFRSEPYGFDADGNRGEIRRVFEVQRQAVFSENHGEVQVDALMQKEIDDHLADMDWGDL